MYNPITTHKMEGVQCEMVNLKFTVALRLLLKIKGSELFCNFYF
jgi:hypothetical protein